MSSRTGGHFFVVQSPTKKSAPAVTGNAQSIAELYSGYKGSNLSFGYLTL
ncbi:hypothetical protein EV199_5902 [Pseudobacter ginsenosidimutans]|uniref:Uncharacterized protein n=1 Tax=Pseudobacter ginsenosidimutans TaxID=661488 RepID=A0A4Q7MAX8_9BACT|nr:hypothetical protein EV199_5902 [Pseudobacter ginsenosidimutans]